MTSDERSIIQRVTEGDTEAYAELVRTHQSRVRLACLVWLGHSEEADDAAQDIFFKAFEALGRFKGESSFLTWILRIANNHCLDRLRQRSRQRTESLDSLLDEKGETWERLIARSQDPDPSPYDPQELTLLSRLFAALPEPDRELLVFREVEQLSYEEMAKRLRCSLDAIKGRLKRVRQNLTEKCRPHFSDTSQSPTRL